jgi:hypothetical protein
MKIETVQDLIDALSQIENKDRPILHGYSEQFELSEVTVDSDIVEGHINLGQKNDNGTVIVSDCDNGFYWDDLKN